MRAILFYATRFGWVPHERVLDEAADTAEPGTVENTVVVFVHVEPHDEPVLSVKATKLKKQIRRLTTKWRTDRITFHSFSHLAREKAHPAAAKAFLDEMEQRLTKAGFEVQRSPFGYFTDFELNTPGAPLTRVYKEL